MRNERGERLIDRCEEKKLAIMNTWFADHPRRRYTWASPGDRTRNQIGYVMINERYQSSVSNAGADANSDHNPVIASIKIYLRALKQWFPTGGLRRSFCGVTNSSLNSLLKTRIFRTSNINILLHQQNRNADRFLWSSHYLHHNSYLITPIQFKSTWLQNRVLRGAG